MYEMKEMQVRSLVREDCLEKEMSIYFQYSFLENSMDRGAQFPGVAKSQTRLSG